MNEPLISVIVPVYKVEQYLDKCINSIVNQTYKNLEIILVDDGSPDKCPQICDEWSKKDSRIVVIHKENGGLSYARNVGLDIATGEFISFVDSDDWIDLELYDTLLVAINNTKSDIACCKFLKVFSNEKDKRFKIKSSQYQVFATKDALLELIIDKNINQVVWNKLYRRDCISNIKFDVGKFNEDEYWSYKVIGNSNKTVVVDFVGYYYLQRNNSIMSNRYSLKRLDAIEAKILRQEYLEKFYPDLCLVGKINLLYTCLYHGQLTYHYLNVNEKERAINILKSSFEKYKLNKLDFRRIRFKDLIWLTMGKYFFKSTCFIRNILKVGV